jgi:inosine/xanthosine triphosphate pyrophosphatase family protein/dephospho-CoA kinase
MNTESVRPCPREVFLKGSKRLEVFFYTSNDHKFLQARAVCRKFGLDLKHFRSRTEPYSEDYSQGKRALLARAVDEVAGQIGASSIFFVEDTSLRIEALSRGDVDFPGLAVKEWFERTRFKGLDAQLKAHGNTRRAVVKSDIALHLPGLRRPIFFAAQTVGVVARTGPRFKASATHPWLTPETFNGWLVPEGATKRLGEMSFEESWGHDFRVRALVQLIDRLEEYAAVLNLGVHGYTRQLRHRDTNAPRLFPANPPSFVVVGHTCSGKTTFGERAEEKFGLRHVDASDIMRSFRAEFANPQAAADDFARHVLETRGADVVARRILDMYSSDIERGLVITGFRTIEELNTVKAHIPDAKFVLIDASSRVRFDRHLQRGRNAKCRTRTDFEALDRRQWVFGLLRVAEDFADLKVTNEGSLDEYFVRVDAILSGSPTEGLRGISRNIAPRNPMETSQLFRSLAVLQDADRPLTCQEIATELQGRGHLILPNNIAKTLRGVPELALEHRTAQRRVRYDIKSSGRAYIRLSLFRAQHASERSALDSG